MVLLVTSLTEVYGKQRLVVVHNLGIFGKFSFLRQYYTALKVDSKLHNEVVDEVMLCCRPAHLYVLPAV